MNKKTGSESKHEYGVKKGGAGLLCKSFKEKPSQPSPLESSRPSSLNVLEKVSFLTWILPAQLKLLEKPSSRRRVTMAPPAGYSLKLFLNLVFLPLKTFQ